MSEEAKVQFAQLAVQYYVAGRYAAIAQLIPVLGNLLHHAIEMSLKAALAEHMTLKELKNIGHDLTKVWVRFKSFYPAAPATQFDDAITALHRFEDLRYPDSVLAKGAQMELVLFREHVGTPPQTSAPTVPRYALVLEEIDDLQAFIFATTNLNPRFFVGSMGTEGTRLLLIHNRSAKVWQ